MMKYRSDSCSSIPTVIELLTPFYKEDLEQTAIYYNIMAPTRAVYIIIAYMQYPNLWITTQCGKLWARVITVW